MKKRILSLILALSMVLSVLPLGAFAEGSLPELVMGANGLPDCSDGSNGNGWRYISGTLYLDEGTYNFSSTHPQNTGAGTRPVPAVRCMIEIRSGVEITGGSFGNSVTNYGTISSGTFQTMGGGVINEGTIKNGTFEGTVTNYGTIENGTFKGDVTNKTNGLIYGGTFQNKCSVTNYGTITGNGTFNGTVTNNAGGEISDGTFKGDVENSGYIEKGTFNGEVTNNTSGTIFGGTFRGQVDNNGKITGGIFAAGLSTTPGTVTGGIFNGNTGLTGAHQVTVTNGSVSTVNDEGPRNADGTTGTAWDLYSYKDTTMTITASTEIFSLNGYPIDGSPYTSSYPKPNDKKTVKFTMPDENVELNRTAEL